MSDRDDILSKLRRHQRPAQQPGPWQSRRDYSDLAATFCAAFVTAGGEAKQLASLDDVRREIGAILEEAEAQRVLQNGDLPIELASQWPQLEWQTAGEAPAELHDFAIRADVGITGVAAALAETGSLLVTSGPGLSRLSSLLPPLHIAVVPRSAIMADIFTWTAGRSEPPPTNMVLISGPSKSADIGMTLNTGVHGPGRVIALVYED